MGDARAEAVRAVDRIPVTHSRRFLLIRQLADRCRFFRHDLLPTPEICGLAIGVPTARIYVAKRLMSESRATG